MVRLNNHRFHRVGNTRPLNHITHGKRKEVSEASEASDHSEISGSGLLFRDEIPVMHYSGARKVKINMPSAAVQQVKYFLELFFYLFSI
jgi:hypothetical protein